MEFSLVLLALVGHAALWVAFFNRTHSTAMPRWLLRLVTVLAFACAVLIPPAFALWFILGGSSLQGRQWLVLAWLGVLYLALCWIAGLATILRWIGRRVFDRPPSVLRACRTRLIDLVSRMSPAADQHNEHHFLANLPGNQILQLDVVDRTLEVPRLAPELDRLSIVHVSDLHFTGLVGKSYFEEVVHQSNLLDPDLVAITGDLIDKPECMKWIPDTLGKLTSRHGVYFVLGNHDQRVGPERLRKTLVDSGLQDLGCLWKEVRIKGQSVILAGNELPWFPPAADMTHAPPPSSVGGSLRIALAHTPDQLEWGQANQIDLLLAGHTHGGQIRIPLIGAILSPSRVGVKYASGTFHAPPTIMHVTRGVSGQFPVRMNCPPEMVRLSLRAACGGT